MAGIDDRTGTEEEERLEKRVRVEVEHACVTSAESNGHDHVAEL
jgi:hypothetical protein